MCFRIECTVHTAEKKTYIAQAGWPGLEENMVKDGSTIRFIMLP